MEQQMGKVITSPFKSEDEVDGNTGILCKGAEVIDIVKIDHLTASGNFFVVGDKFTGKMDDAMYLAKLYVEDEEGKCHQLKFAQWKVAIKLKLINAKKFVPFILLESMFDKGLYLKMCVECGSYYSGGRKSLLCEECSEHKRFAKIVIDKTTKSKRPRIKL